jgi:hypothetical protein
VTTPVFGGPADRRSWHGVLGDDAASWTMDVRVDKVTGVWFVRGPSLFPSFPGEQVLGVQFLGPDGKSVLHCFVHDLYDGQRMRPEKLAAWQALRERYGNRERSRVDHGRLLPPASSTIETTGSREPTANGDSSSARANGWHRRAAAPHSQHIICELGLRQAGEDDRSSRGASSFLSLDSMAWLSRSRSSSIAPIRL